MRVRVRVRGRGYATSARLGLLERGALGRAVAALEECTQRRVAWRLLKPAQGMGLGVRLRDWGWG